MLALVLIGHAGVPATTALAQPTTPNPGLKYYYDFDSNNAPPVVNQTYDIVVYGGTSAGVTAAVQAARMGKSVALVEFGREVGGMTSGGLVHTDRVDEQVQGGLAREFFDGVGRDSNFNPSQAKTQFEQMLANPGNGAPAIPVYYEKRLDGVAKTGNRITSITTENGSTFQADMFIDATYEGDLMAAADVTYTVGREPRSKYNESRAGIASPVNLGIDPYNTPGVPSSGLIYGVSDEPYGSRGDGDDGLQAYNFRMYLTKNNPQPIQQPAGYDKTEYEILKRRILTGNSSVWKGNFEKDTNNHEVFQTDLSTDHVGGNVIDDNGNPVTWADASYQQREQMYQSHVRWNLGMLYWLANDPDLHALANDSSQPQDVQDLVQRIINDMDGLGFAQGEHTETGGFPRQLYVREARRMVSDEVMTQAHYLGDIVVDDPIALANYFADSHHVRRIVVDGKVHAEGNTGGGPESIWGISYKSIVPADGEASNLVVPTTISASSVAWNSMRMEPTFMVLGQTAATAAALAIDAGVDVQDLDYDQLEQELIVGGQLIAHGTNLRTGNTYDENDTQANAVDTEATGNNISLADFKTLITRAADNGDGGVIDFERNGFETSQGLDAAYGVNGEKTLGISVGSNSELGFDKSWKGVPADATPISYSRVLRGAKVWDFEFDTGLTAVAVTILDRAGGAVDMIVELADGQRHEVVTGQAINDDTFFAYAADASNPIVSLELDNNGKFNELDDLAFIVELLPGDANLDGVVDGLDIGILVSNFDEQGGFTEGDFNFDGVVDGLDIGLLVANFGGSNAALEPLVELGYESIPEPAASVLIGLGGAVMLAGRRRPG